MNVCRLKQAAVATKIESSINIITINSKSYTKLTLILQKHHIFCSHHLTLSTLYLSYSSSKHLASESGSDLYSLLIHYACEFHTFHGPRISKLTRNFSCFVIALRHAASEIIKLSARMLSDINISLRMKCIFKMMIFNQPHDGIKKNCN